MKNKLFLLSVLGLTALSNYVSAQCSNSGIGTTAPAAKLDIRGCGNDSTSVVLKVANSTDTTINPLLYVRGDHRIGIGTKFPQTMLDVNGTIFGRQGFKFPDGTVQSTAAGTGASSWALGSGQNSIINNISGWNVANGVSSFIGGGDSNTVAYYGFNSIILGGQKNYVGDDNCVILSGTNNTIMDPVIIGGGPNQSYNLISGGSHNFIHDNVINSGIIQGEHNTIGTGVHNSVILGGSWLSATDSNTVYMQNLNVASWAGSGDRAIMADAHGNLRVGSSTQSLPYWLTTGNVVGTSGAFLGTNDAADLILKTTGIERMHIMQEDPNGLISGFTGIRTITTSTSPAAFIPQHDLHLHSDVIIDLGSGGIATRHANCCLMPDTTLNFDSLGTRFSATAPTGDVYTSLSTFQITNAYTQPNSTTPPTEDNGLIMGMNGRNGFLRMQESSMNFDISSAGGLSLSGEGNRQIFLGSHGGGQMMLQTLGTSIFMTPTMMRLKINSQFAIAIPSNGNVGIGGILTPTSRLQVQAVDASTTSSAVNVTDVNGASLFFVRNDGSVGVGTTFANGNSYYYKLAVAGRIGAKDEVTVENASTAWYDFVFESSYQRMNFHEKELFFKKNKHLPNVDSEKEITGNGLKVGKTLAGITFNVEENSLDIIDLYKQNDDQKDEIQKLKEENELLKKQLEMVVKNVEALKNTIHK